jgi:16S rRNA (cytosine967-C5)-methyltransferase
MVNDASLFNDDFPVADRVLCDVPCSGMGIISKKPEIKYKKLDEFKELYPIQKQILETASRYVKEGGRLVYSTCSVNPNENRKICDSFLKDNSDFYSVKALPDIERAVEEGDYLTLFPHKNKCDGFFIAVFHRK